MEDNNWEEMVETMGGLMELIKKLSYISKCRDVGTMKMSTVVRTKKEIIDDFLKSEGHQLQLTTDIQHDCFVIWLMEKVEQSRNAVVSRTGVESQENDIKMNVTAVVDGSEELIGGRSGNKDSIIAVCEVTEAEENNNENVEVTVRNKVDTSLVDVHKEISRKQKLNVSREGNVSLVEEHTERVHLKQFDVVVDIPQPVLATLAFVTKFRCRNGVHKLDVKRNVSKSRNSLSLPLFCTCSDQDKFHFELEQYIDTNRTSEKGYLYQCFATPDKVDDVVGHFEILKEDDRNSKRRSRASGNVSKSVVTESEPARKTRAAADKSKRLNTVDRRGVIESSVESKEKMNYQMSVQNVQKMKADEGKKKILDCSSTSLEVLCGGGKTTSTENSNASLQMSTPITMLTEEDVDMEFMKFKMSAIAEMEEEQSNEESTENFDCKEARTKCISILDDSEGEEE